MKEPKQFWVIWDDSLCFEGISGASYNNLLVEVAKLRKFWPIYTGYNQWLDPRYHYSCVIVSYLRQYTSLFNIPDQFDQNMKELCDYCELKWTWLPNAGGYVVEIGKDVVEYLNKKYPHNRVTLHRVKYGSSLMGTAINRNIPILTAYFSSQSYYDLKKDWIITEKEAQWNIWSGYGHCITITSLGYLWAYLGMQDNYEGDPSNEYKIFWFKFLLPRAWQKNTFFLMLPENMKQFQKKPSN